MAAVIMVVLLALIGMMVIGMVLTGARDMNLTGRRIETVQAFYAAEAGMNLSLREMMKNSDEDGDGTIGTISDDGNAGNDPTIGSAQVSVTAVVAGAQTTLTSKARAGSAIRSIKAVVSQ